ncbi:MAG: Xaa-Pro peptidase family protein, partial [Chloroflexota bacterium]|nr:Xaa-Pro peptidase family protein [Chloroflexota bacterium]
AVDGGACLVVPGDGEPALVMDPPEFGGALLGVWFDDLHGYQPEIERPSYVARMLGEHAATRGRIGLDGAAWGATTAFYAGLAHALPLAEIVDATDVPVELKRRKSAAEIEHIRRAAVATQAAVAAATSTAAAGVTDGEVAGAAFEAMARAGSEYPCLSPIVTSGGRSGMLHTTHKRHAILAGDNVLLEIGACVQRYTAPQMRTLTIGPPAAEVRAAADACLAALNAVLEAMGPGRAARDAAEAGWRELRAAGDDLVFHGTFGYGIGAGFPPNWADGSGFVRSDEDSMLEPGMVFHHPVAVRRLGEFGVAFSETSVITQDGCQVLTRGPRELVER